MMKYEKDTKPSHFGPYPHWKRAADIATQLLAGSGFEGSADKKEHALVLEGAVRTAKEIIRLSRKHIES